MDPDTGWHIAAGDLIWQQGQIPLSDPWSFTANGQLWYNISWAYDAFLSALHGVGGLPAVVIVTAFFYALAVALMGAIALKSSKSMLAAVLVTALLGFVLLPGMLARPQGLTFLIIIGFYWLLRFGSLKQLWIVPCLMALWANLHGGFLVGFIIIGMFVIEAFFAGSRERLLRLIIVGVLSSLAVFLTPYGFGIVEAVQLTMGSAMKSVLMEWQPTNLGVLKPATLFVGLFVLVSALFEPRIPLADKLLACFWIAMGLISVRMMHIAALLAMPYLAQSVALRLKQSPIGSLVEKRDRVYTADLARPIVRRVLASIACVGVVVMFIPSTQRALAGQGEKFASFPEHHAPDEALDFVKANYPGLRLYNRYGLGGYLIYRERGAVPVFVDGRADTAYPRGLLKDAVSIGYMSRARAQTPANAAAWRKLVDAHQIEGFLVTVDGRLYDQLMDKKDWANVVQSEFHALFVRADLVTPT